MPATAGEAKMPVEADGGAFCAACPSGVVLEVCDVDATAEAGAEGVGGLDTAAGPALGRDPEAVGSRSSTGARPVGVEQAANETARTSSMLLGHTR